MNASQSGAGQKPKRPGQGRTVALRSAKNGPRSSRPVRRVSRQRNYLDGLARLRRDGLARYIRISCPECGGWRFQAAPAFPVVPKGESWA